MNTSAKICVVGAGWWGQGWHLPQLFRNKAVEIVGIVEPCSHPKSVMAELESIEILASKYNGIDCDGFVVSTTHATHYEIAAKILSANKHLLLEKPMTVDPVEAEKLHQLANNGSFNKFFQINHSANWRNQTKKACELIKTGEIGKIRYINTHMGSPLRELFEDTRSTGWTRLANGDTSGFGWGQLTHILAWVLLVTQLEPCEAFCMMGYSEITQADLFNAATVRFKCGAIMTVSGIATIPPSSDNKQIDNKIFGDKGMLIYSGNDGDPSSGNLLVKYNDGRKISFEDAMHADDEVYGNLRGFYFENTEKSELGPESLQDFVNACLGEKYWEGASSLLGSKVVKTVSALYRSAKSNRLEIIK